MSEFGKPVLAIDSTLSGCTAALLDARGQAYSRAIETDRDQAAKLIPMVQEMMGEAGASFPDLGLIVTTIGPGSFTGLRIGLSSARALGMALSIPVQGVDTFSAMAASCAQDGDRAGYAIVLETKREDFYFQVLVPDLSADGAPVCGAIEAVREKINGREAGMILCGDATERLLGALGGDGFVDVRTRRLLDPAALVRLGLARFEAAGRKAAKPEPFYMRGADVSLSNKAQRKIKDFPV